MFNSSKFRILIDRSKFNNHNTKYSYNDLLQSSHNIGYIFEEKRIKGIFTGRIQAACLRGDLKGSIPSGIGIDGSIDSKSRCKSIVGVSTKLDPCLKWNSKRADIPLGSRDCVNFTEK